MNRTMTLEQSEAHFILSSVKALAQLEGYDPNSVKDGCWIHSDDTKLRKWHRIALAELKLAKDIFTSY